MHNWNFCPCVIVIFPMAPEGGIGIVGEAGLLTDFGSAVAATGKLASNLARVKAIQFDEMSIM